MEPIPACSIVSNNYLAFARVFAESYRRHHPGATVFVCIVDTPHRTVSYEQMPFTPIFAHELEIPRFHNFAFRYDILELNTAVKPYLLSHLRERFQLDRVFYFDPDILVCDRLDELAGMLDRKSVILTPHITQPLDDDYLPSERSILRAGIFNLGFVGVRFDPQTADLLEWWKRRLYRFCLVDPPNGLFVDQSWMGLAPALVDSLGIVRDPIYNIAYWNLSHRRVSVEPGQWRIDGRKIGFFHFSGIDLEEIEIVSHHQDRLTLAERPDVRPCFERYRKLVLAAGHDEFNDLPYGYGKFHDPAGIHIPRTARWALQRVDPEGRRWPNPFDTGGDDPFIRWLIEPISYRNGSLNRLALSLWEERRDLMQAFPSVKADDLPSYVSWLRIEADRGEIEALFLEGVSAKSAPELELRRATELLLGLDHLGLLPGLAEWLNQPVSGNSREKPVVTRLALMMYEMRPDLQAIFPDPLDRNRRQFAQWFLTHGRQDYRLPPILVEPIESSLEPEEIRTVAAYRLAKTADIVRDLIALRDPPDLASWLNQPASGSEGRRPLITRLAMVIYGGRQDLQVKYPKPFGESRLDFARWFIGRGRRDYHIPQALVEPVRRSFPPGDAPVAGRSEREGSLAINEIRRGAGKPANKAKAASSSPVRGARRRAVRGVNLGGYFDAGSGVGQMGRASVAALEHAGVPFVRAALDRDFSERKIRNMIHPVEGMPYPVTLLNANADETIWALSTMPLAVTESYKIGYWYWELSHFPLKFADRFALLDEIWAASRFCKNSFEVTSPIPVRLVPPFVPPPAFVDVDRSVFSLDDDRFVFFYAFDAGSIPERKNPAAAIECIRRLPPETRRRVGLLLKISRGDLAPGLIPQLRREALGLPVYFYTEKASRLTVERMLAACDAVLSLHRSEGLGLLPIEGLYLEKPVIATAYGGVTDYLDEETGFPVMYDLKTLDRDYPPYEYGSVWADPSIDDAVAQMLVVVENSEEAARRAAAGKRRIEETYGLDAASKRFSGELDRIFELLDEPRS